MAKYRKDGRIDLRTIGDKPTQEEREALTEEIREYGIEPDKYLASGNIRVIGRDNQGRTLSSMRNPKDLVSDLRKISKMSASVERQREKYGLDSYKTRAVNTLVAAESDAKHRITGTKNYIETLKKQLAKSENANSLGMNKLEIAARNREELQVAKIEALGGIEKLADFVKVDLKRYLKKDKSFKSRSKKAELYNILSNSFVDEGYMDSPDMFYPWLVKQNIHVNQESSATIQELYKEYVNEKLQDQLQAKRLGAREADNMKFSEQEIIDRLNELGTLSERMAKREDIDLTGDGEDE